VLGSRFGKPCGVVTGLMLAKPRFRRAELLRSFEAVPSIRNCHDLVIGLSIADGKLV